MMRAFLLLLVVPVPAIANTWYFACSSSSCAQNLTTTAPTAVSASATSSCTTSTSMVEAFAAKTPQLDAVTVSGSITCYLWCVESNVGCNNGAACTITYQSECATDTSTVMTGAASAECGNSAGQVTSTATVTSTSVAAGGCLRVGVGKIQSGGTGGTSRNISLAYTGGTGVTCPGASCTTSYVTFTETLALCSTCGLTNSGMMGFWGVLSPTLWRLLFDPRIEATWDEAMDPNGDGHGIMVPMEDA